MEEADQITHLVGLDEEINPETGLDVFKVSNGHNRRAHRQGTALV